MSDSVDDANATNEVLLSAAIANRNTEQLASTGFYLNCSDPLALGARFCDSDCRDDYQKREFMKHGR